MNQNAENFWTGPFPATGANPGSSPLGRPNIWNKFPTPERERKDKPDLREQYVSEECSPWSKCRLGNSVCGCFWRGHLTAGTDPPGGLICPYISCCSCMDLSRVPGDQRCPTVFQIRFYGFCTFIAQLIWPQPPMRKVKKDSTSSLHRLRRGKHIPGQ